MKTIQLSALLIGAIFCALSSGCTVIREYTPEKKEVKVQTQEYELARKLVQAFVKNDAKAFIALLPEETQAKFTEEMFAATRKSVTDSVGEPAAFSYVTTLELPALHPQIWKIQFRRKNINETREYTSEILFKVVTGMTNKKEAAIVGFFFI